MMTSQSKSFQRYWHRIESETINYIIGVCGTAIKCLSGHIETTATPRMDYLVTWNFKHINNASTRTMVVDVVTILVWYARCCARRKS